MQSGGEVTPAAKRSGAAVLAVEELHDQALESLADSKAEQIVSIDISDKSSIGDHMVIASGRSHRHVGAIADHLLRRLKNIGAGTPRTEGLKNGDWVLIDAGDVIVHIFRPEIREFYGLEKMWSAPDTREVAGHG